MLWHKIDALLYYLRASSTTARDLDQAEKAARILPWATPDVLRVEDRKLPVLLTLIRISNCKGRHAAAYEDLEIYEVASPPMSLLDPDYLLQRAIALAGKGTQLEAQALYVDAVVLSSVTAGAWHRQTLHTLYELGRALKAWDRHEQAVKLSVCLILFPYKPTKSLKAAKAPDLRCKGCVILPITITAVRGSGQRHTSRRIS